MTYTIEEVRVRGDSFGQRGDASITIKFKIDGLTDANRSFVNQLLSEEISTTYQASRNPGVSITINSLHYNPRFDYQYTDPSIWKIFTMDELLEMIEKASNKVQEVLPATVLPMKVVKMLESFNAFDSVYSGYDRRNKVWNFTLYMSQPPEYREWNTYLDKTYHSANDRVSTKKHLVFTYEQLECVDELSIKNLINEMASEVNEMSMVRAAIRKLVEKVQAHKFDYSSPEPQKLKIWSYEVPDKFYTIEWVNGHDLMNKVDAFDVEKFAEESGHNEALRTQRASRRRSTSDEKEKLKLVNETKQKLSDEWTVITTRVREMNSKVM